jgi:hypothetical protein
VSPSPRSLITSDLSGATSADILELAEAHQVRFLRLQFTDILGVIKNVEVPASQFRKALKGDILFDGSSIEGFVRVEESDMLLARPEHLPGLSVGRSGGARGAPDLRREPPRRHVRSMATRGRCSSGRWRRRPSWAS